MCRGQGLAHRAGAQRDALRGAAAKGVLDTLGRDRRGVAEPRLGHRCDPGLLQGGALFLAIPLGAPHAGPG